MTDYTFRPATYDDLPAIQAMLVAAGAVDQNPNVAALADLQREFDDEWSPTETDTHLVLTPTGEVAAFGRLFTNPRPEDMLRTFIDADVHPAHRAAGLLDLLLDWAETRTRARQAEISAATGFTGERHLRTGVNEILIEEVATYQRHGFRPIRYFYRMRRDLSEPIPDLPAPAGLRLAHFEPEHSEALRQADNEAFTDHWQHEDITPVDWDKFFIGHTAFRPDLTFVLHDGDQIAAFSLNKVDVEENERQGYTTGWVNALGTRRPWRKRGLAAYLLTQSFKAFKAEGLSFATLGVDAENPSGALGLYERLGFKTFRRTLLFNKELA